MYEEAALREQISVAGEVLESLVSIQNSVKDVGGVVYEEAALRERICVAGQVLESLAQRLAGTIFLLEAAEPAMNQGQVLSLITKAKKVLREGLREAREATSDLLP